VISGRWFQALLVCILGVIMLGASPQDSSARFGRLGHNMMCVCGCGQILLECNHVGCPDSERMIGELHDQMDGPNGAGADSLILNWFVAKYGATVLAAPIRGGFDNVAWITPLVAGILAIFGTAIVVRMWSDRKRRLAPAAAVNPVAEDELRARIRRETEY
jgi:cytochrome c-type biogenesis protein CcmH